MKGSFRILFIFLIIASIIQLPILGVSTDEIFQRDHRLVNAREYFSKASILNRAPSTVSEPIFLNEYPFKYYGVGIQYPLILLEYFPETLSPERPWFWIISHAYTHAIFLVSVVAFWSILTMLGASSPLTLLGTTLYALHPRIYGPSFYNIKDVMFLSLLTIGLWSILRSTISHSRYAWILAGIVTAFAINSRVMGLLLVVLAIGIPVIQFILRKISLKVVLQSVGIFLLSLAISLYAMWPVLWNNPVQELYNALVVFGNYLEWDNVIVFRGQVLSGVSPPIDYVSTWIWITSPSTYHIAWIAGIIGAFFLLLKWVLDRSYTPSNITTSAWISVVVFAGVQSLLILADSTMYNAWRHTSFLHLPLTILAVFGVRFLWQIRSQWIRVIGISLISFSLIHQLEWIAFNTPFHHLYFNNIIVRDTSNWDRDYWQLSAKYVIEDVIEREKNDHKIVFAENLPTLLAFKTLDDSHRDRARIDATVSNIEYLLVDYDGIVGEDIQPPLLGFEPYRFYQFGNSTIIAVFAHTTRASLMR